MGPSLSNLVKNSIWLPVDGADVAEVAEVAAFPMLTEKHVRKCTPPSVWVVPRSV